ncbi:S1C family serine protease [Nocardia sp. CA-107356]|uniref:S1C family serine protease n=1 Tax=Nocardia sp. CA-107356 TaxID=3239972 RepID=UPI003D91EC45
MEDQRHRAPEEQRVGSGGRALALFIAVLFAVATFFGFRAELADWSSPSGAENSAPALLEPQPPLDPVVVAQSVEPALVNISTSSPPLGLGAAGSGIVLTADGQVLTSHHVVKGADTVTVTDVGNGAVYDAKVLGYDASADIALLELSGAADLVIARVGNSADLRVHEQVLAIGNAGGTGGTPTSVQGNITDLNSTIVALNTSDLTRKSLTGMVEIAAVVSAGQSGGALADPGGAVVGVITAASGETAHDVGRTPNGYAVPIDTAMRVVYQIRSGTPTETVHIGPTATLGVLISDANPSGARVDVALYGLPAHAAGLVDGDVITSIDGRDISTAKALRAAINVRKPDDTVLLGVTGVGGARRAVSVVLALGTPN